MKLSSRSSASVSVAVTTQSRSRARATISPVRPWACVPRRKYEATRLRSALALPTYSTSPRVEEAVDAGLVGDAGERRAAGGDVRLHGGRSSLRLYRPCAGAPGRYAADIPRRRCRPAAGRCDAPGRSAPGRTARAAGRQCRPGSTSSVDGTLASEPHGEVATSANAWSWSPTARAHVMDRDASDAGSIVTVGASGGHAARRAAQQRAEQEPGTVAADSAVMPTAASSAPPARLPSARVSCLAGLLLATHTSRPLPMAAPGAPALVDMTHGPSSAGGFAA